MLESICPILSYSYEFEYHQSIGISVGKETCCGHSCAEYLYSGAIRFKKISYIYKLCDDLCKTLIYNNPIKVFISVSVVCFASLSRKNSLIGSMKMLVHFIKLFIRSEEIRKPLDLNLI